MDTSLKIRVDNEVEKVLLEYKIIWLQAIDEKVAYIQNSCFLLAFPLLFVERRHSASTSVEILQLQREIERKISTMQSDLDYLSETLSNPTTSTSRVHKSSSTSEEPTSASDSLFQTKAKPVEIHSTPQDVDKDNQDQDRDNIISPNSLSPTDPLYALFSSLTLPTLPQSPTTSEEMGTLDNETIEQLLKRMDAAEGAADGLEERLDGLIGTLDSLLGALEGSPSPLGKEELSTVPEEENKDAVNVEGDKSETVHEKVSARTKESVNNVGR